MGDDKDIDAIERVAAIIRRTPRANSAVMPELRAKLKAKEKLHKLYKEKLP